jgi:hypothetical protein
VLNATVRLPLIRVLSYLITRCRVMHSAARAPPMLRTAHFQPALCVPSPPLTNPRVASAPAAAAAIRCRVASATGAFLEPQQVATRVTLATGVLSVACVPFAGRTACALAVALLEARARVCALEAGPAMTALCLLLLRATPLPRLRHPGLPHPHQSRRTLEISQPG